MNRDRAIPDLVSLREAAEILGISKQAAHLRATRDKLPGQQLGDGSWVFRRVLVEKLAKKKPTP